MNVARRKGKILTKTQVNRRIRKQLRRAKINPEFKRLRRIMLRMNTGIHHGPAVKL